MAIENKTIVSKASGVFHYGSEVAVIPFQFEVAAADDNGSVFRIPGISTEMVPVKMEIFNDAITGSADWDVGIYDTDTGDAVDADAFADGLNMSSAAGRAAPKDGLKDLAIDDVTERLRDLAGETLEGFQRVYDIAFTANTIGSAAGTISGYLYLAQA